MTKFPVAQRAQSELKASNILGFVLNAVQETPEVGSYYGYDATKQLDGAIETMIRLFNVYYPTRTIVLLLCEALIVSGCFLLATVLLLGPDTYLVLNYEYGGLKIFGLTILTLLCSYYFDLYEPQRISARWEIYFRLLLVLGFLSFLLSAIIYFFPDVDIPGHYVLLLGLMFLTAALVAWRSAYEWIIGREMFRERVYVLGAGERAQTIVELLQTRKDAGMHVDWLGWCADRQGGAQRGVQCCAGGFFGTEAAGRPRHCCA